ncbi:MAG: hypothetical protein ACREBS_06640 [Nitrososphaerales archaeon]
MDGRFAVQSDVATQVANALSIRITKPERERIKKGRTESVAAFENYLKGKQLLAGLSKESITMAIELFEKATSEDPNFAETFAGLAHAYELLGHHSHIVSDESYKLSGR